MLGKIWFHTILFRWGKRILLWSHFRFPPNSNLRQKGAFLFKSPKRYCSRQLPLPCANKLFFCINLICKSILPALWKKKGGSAMFGILMAWSLLSKAGSIQKKYIIGFENWFTSNISHIYSQLVWKCPHFNKKKWMWKKRC